MQVLVVGSGGREHALVWKLAQSNLVDKIFAAPGNGGTLAEGATNVDLKPNDLDGLVKFAKDQGIGLVVPGPELPLTLGLTDLCLENNLPCFGPDKYAATLEGSKAFAKEVMRKAHVPTAQATLVSDLDVAKQVLAKSNYPIVIKADGLAQGKGVLICQNAAEALDAVTSMLSEGRFGQAGAKVLIEECLEGQEVSLLCICDGHVAKPMPSAQDHKRAFDNDMGLNTGGMGAYSPCPLLPDSDLEQVAKLTIEPILKVMAEDKHPFVGVLYAGLMLTSTGPKVLEYNVRFGDPECQPLLMRLKNDLAQVMLDAIHGRLGQTKLEFTAESALGVVVAKDGYPGSYSKGAEISGLSEAEKLPLVKVFHSGTDLVDAKLVSSGGRILCVTALGENLRAAQDHAYEAVKKIAIDKSFYRHDIGSKVL